MINLAASSLCTGCSSCMNSCSRQAIAMEKDEFGFWVPQINYEECIECGACQLKCPVLNSPNIDQYESAYYAVAVNELLVRDEGSSGGAFGYLAEAVLREGGTVFGAFFNAELGLMHGSSDEVALEKLKKSKYLESRIDFTFQKCKETVVSGKKVLFCGAPCQIEGLKSYLGKDYENLLTADFLCHGVPSAMVFDKYLDYLTKKNGSEVISVEFRSKALGWKTYCIRSTFKNGKSHVGTKFEDPYLTEFFDNKVLRESCYSCSRNTKSSADLTLGDFWGVVNYKEIEDDDTGISMLRSNTIKGARAVESALNDCSIGVHPLPLSSVDYAFHRKRYTLDGRSERLTAIRESGFPLVSKRRITDTVRGVVYKARGLARGFKYAKKLKRAQRAKG